MSDVVSIAGWLPIYHITGCQQAAFYTKHRLYPGDLMRSENFALPDGSPIEEGSLMRCGTCYDAVNKSDLAMRA